MYNQVNGLFAIATLGPTHLFLHYESLFFQYDLPKEEHDASRY